MSEETKVAQEEQAVPASTEQDNTSTSSDAGSLIAESKKYRARARKSEEQVASLQSKLEAIETEKLKEKEQWQELFEKRDAEAKEMESTAKLLKFSKRITKSVFTDETIAAKRAADGKHPFKDMNTKERVGNWQKVMDYYNKN